MERKTIKEILSPIYWVNSNVTVDKAIIYMLSKETGAILIKNEQGDYIGIFNKTDLIKLLEKDLNPSTITVSPFIISLIKSLDQTESRDEAKAKMIENNIHHHAVTDGVNIINTISNNDVNI